MFWSRKNGEHATEVIILRPEKCTDCECELLIY